MGNRLFIICSDQMGVVGVGHLTGLYRNGT